MDLFDEVALHFNTTREEVLENIKEAISGGFNDPDPKVREMWDLLFPGDKEPEPELFVRVIAKIVKAQQDK